MKEIEEAPAVAAQEAANAAIKQFSQQDAGPKALWSSGFRASGFVGQDPDPCIRV